MTDIDQLAGRVAALERHGRILIAALIVSLAAGFGLGQANAREEVVPGDLKVRSLSVVDPRGVTRVRLAAPLPEPIVAGKVRKRDGAISGILLYDAKGNERSGYATAEGYANVLFTLDDEKQQRVLFLAEPGGATTLRLFSRTGDKAEMNLVDDKPGLVLVKDGATVFQAPAAN